MMSLSSEDLASDNQAQLKDKEVVKLDDVGVIMAAESPAAARARQALGNLRKAHRWSHKFFYLLYYDGYIVSFYLHFCCIIYMQYCLFTYVC